MTPLRFGKPSRQLFGLYEAPSSGVAGAQGVLLCNPFGQEAIRVHRLMRIVGERLTQANVHVLRFDYLGTGDSDGADAEGDVDTWVGDVMRADRELARVGGVSRISWFGVRLGASLAAFASARAPIPPDRLVLWDPIIEGPAYLAELALAHDAALRLDGPEIDGSAGEREEALGFPLTASVRRSFAGMSAASFAGTRAARVFLVAGGGSGGASPLEETLRASGASVSTLPIETEIVWASDEAMNTAIVPADALNAIVASLTERE